MLTARASLKMLSQAVFAAPCPSFAFMQAPVTNILTPTKILETPPVTTVQKLRSFSFSSTSLMIQWHTNILQKPPIANPQSAIKKAKANTLKFILIITINPSITTIPVITKTYCTKVQLASFCVLTSYTFPKQQEPTIVDMLNMIERKALKPYQPLLSMQVGNHSKKVQVRALQQQMIIVNNRLFGFLKNCQKQCLNSLHITLSCSSFQSQLLFSPCSQGKKQQIAQLNKKEMTLRTIREICQLHYSCIISKDGKRKPTMLPKSPAADQNPSLLPSFSVVQQLLIMLKETVQLLQRKKPQTVIRIKKIGLTFSIFKKLASDRKGNRKQAETNIVELMKKCFIIEDCLIILQRKRKPTPLEKQRVPSTAPMQVLDSLYVC